MIATLIAEQLRVVPTSLDQPETAVALGAHHVPQEGITMRTSDISGAIDVVQRTQAMAPAPRTGGFAAAPPPPPPSYPPTGPQPAPMPQSGPIPVAAPPRPVAAPVQYVGHQPPPPPASTKKPVMMWIIVTVVAFVVVGTVGAIVLVNAFKDDSGGGSTNAGGGGSVSNEACGDKTPDGKGFSKCMRTLAGQVLQSGTCQSGLVMPTGGDPIPAPGATAATCKLSGNYTIFYYHFASADIAAQNVDAFLAGFSKKKSDADQGDWDGGGLKGKYYAIDAGMGIGALMFTVDNSPVMGTLMKLSTGGSSQSLPDYFNEHVKPGGN